MGNNSAGLLQEGGSRKPVAPRTRKLTNTHTHIRTHAHSLPPCHTHLSSRSSQAPPNIVARSESCGTAIAHDGTGWVAVDGVRQRGGGCVCLAAAAGRIALCRDRLRLRLRQLHVDAWMGADAVVRTPPHPTQHTHTQTRTRTRTRTHTRPRAHLHQRQRAPAGRDVRAANVEVYDAAAGGPGQNPLHRAGPGGDRGLWQAVAR